MDYLKFAADNARRQFSAPQDVQKRARALMLGLRMRWQSLADVRTPPDSAAWAQCEQDCEHLIIEALTGRNDAAYAAYLKGEQPDPRD